MRNPTNLRWPPRSLRALALGAIYACAVATGTLAIPLAPTAHAQEGGGTGEPKLTAKQSEIMKKLATALKEDKDAIMGNPNLTNDQRGEALKQLMLDTMKVIDTILTPEQKAALQAQRAE